MRERHNPIGISTCFSILASSMCLSLVMNLCGCSSNEHSPPPPASPESQSSEVVVQPSAPEDPASPPSVSAPTPPQASQPIPAPSQPASPETPPTEQPGSDQTNSEELYLQEFNRLSEKAYALRDEYIRELDDLMAQAKLEYHTLQAQSAPVSEEALLDLVSKYSVKGNELEDECDRRLVDIVIELEALLLEHGKDLGPADTMYETYIREKSEKRNWYMDQIQMKD